MKISRIPSRDPWGSVVFRNGFVTEDFVAYRDGTCWIIAHRCGAELYEANTSDAAATLLRVTQVAYDAAWPVWRIERLVGELPVVDSEACFRDVIDEGVEATTALFTGS